MTKQCTKCGETKDLSCFNKRLLKNGTNVGTSHCKKCVYETAQAWKKAHPERTKEQHKRSKLKNIERYRAYDREYKRKNRDKIRPREERYIKQRYEDGKYHVYILPEEHYCGQSKQPELRWIRHSYANRVTKGAEIVMSFKTRKEAKTYEAMFHALGWYGENKNL